MPSRRDRITPVDPLVRPRPLPGIPSRRLPGPRLEDEALVRDALRAASKPPPALAPAPEPEPPAPSVTPEVDRAIGRAVRAVLAKLWPALVAGALGTGGAIAARPEAPAARVDAHGIRLGELEAEFAKEREERRLADDQQRATDEAIACRLRVLASVAKRQSYDTGFTEEVLWLSEYLASAPKAPPMWRTTERCAPMPQHR
jgi:hypothetical protein